MEYRVTFHAATRYRERVNRKLRTGAARRELAGRVKGLCLTCQAPEWLLGYRRTDADGYLLLDEATCAIVCAGSIVTVVTRAMADEWVRRRCRQLGWMRGSREPAAA